MQYSPNEVKLAVAGDGGADKDEVQTDGRRGSCSLRRGRRDPPDAADALALALCHCWRAPLRPSRGGSAVARARRRHRRRVAKDGRTMIGSLRGTVLERSADGRGARRGRRRRLPRARAAAARCPTLEPGDDAFLFTHLHVREDAMMLYGFPTRDERDTFEALIGAHGVGPTLALAILSVHSPDRAAPRASPTTTSPRSCSCPASARGPRSGCSSS